MNIHKHIFYIAGLALFLSSSFAFSWDHIDLQTRICNKTPYDLHLQKTYQYQADTSNDHSVSQDISAGKCVAVDYWMQWKDNGYDNDDRLTFSISSIGKQTDYGIFDITGFHPSSISMGIGGHIVESNLHGLVIANSRSATNAVEIGVPWTTGLATITVA